MGIISVKHRGNFIHTERFFNNILGKKYLNKLDDFGKLGVEALSKATPVKSGLTASSWSYRIEKDSDQTSIVWFNSNENNGVNIAVILQYGHGTGTGGYVQGRDYINPAMRPVFDKIAEEAWKGVVSL